MSAAVITAEGLGKHYRIGLKEQMSENLAGIVIDFLKSPLSNYRKYRSLYRFDDLQAGHESGDIFWALRDVSFEVREGEVLGIIGRNGAGKSTLLKILSRITDPSTGRAEIRGRVSSLLEVGTGFHPELSGRENVYLNAAILGMKKREIDRKFDEIIEFSGIEKFIDTPVKRYSSGMKVRLAFSVAAHLEPEVLIIDEVLAVGDAVFQKKCLGKMNSMAGGGRTVLFVSHDMSAVNQLCGRVLWFENGGIKSNGVPSEIIPKYLSAGSKSKLQWHRDSGEEDKKEMFFESVKLLSANSQEIETLSFNEPYKIQIVYRVNQNIRNLSITYQLYNENGLLVYESIDTDMVNIKDSIKRVGCYKSDCHVTQPILKPGKYSIHLAAFIENVAILERLENVLIFEVTENGYFLNKNRYGVVFPVFYWEVVNISEVDSRPAVVRELRAKA